MVVQRWHPLKELESMRKEMERIWEDIFPTEVRPRPEEQAWKRPANSAGTAKPAVDIIDRDEEVVILAEMPGVKKENLDISLQDSTLSIKGEVTGYEGENFTYSERDYRFFERAINIPVKVHVEKIKANLKDGVLEVHLPKIEEVKTRKIKIEVAGEEHKK